MKKVCEYQGYYIDYDEETGDEDVLKCKLFTSEGDWEEYCYCDEEERNNCMLYKYSKYIENKDKEIERLNNIINNDDVYGYIKHLEDLTTKKDNIINELDRRLKSDIKTLEINKDCDMKVQTTIDAFQFYIDTIIQLKGSNE